MYFEPIPVLIAKNKGMSVLYIKFSKEAMRIIGILKILSEIIVGEDVSIMKFFSSNTNVALFLDTIDKVKLSRIIEKVRERIRYVKDIKVYISDIEGFASLPDAYPKFFGERAIILRESAFKSMMECILDHLKVAPQLVLYLMGRKMGEAYAETHMKIFNGMNLESIIKIAEKIFTATGFGKVEVVKRSLNPMEMEYNIYDCIECKINIETNRKVKSSMIRGLLEGYFTKLLGREMECMEEECITQGNDKCKMKIKPIELEVA